IHVIVISGTVKLIRSRLHGDVEHTAADLSIFGSVVAGLNGRFLNGVHTGLRLRRDSRGTRVGSVLSIDAEGLRVVRRSVDPDLSIGGPISSRNQQDHGVGIADARATRL